MPGFPCPGYVPASGFFTLLPACSSPGLPGLFHPGGTRGLRPSGVSPPEEPCRLPSGPCPPGFRHRVGLPSGLGRDGSRRLDVTSENMASKPWLPSGPCSPRESVRDPNAVSARIGRSPPGLLPSRVFHVARVDAFASILPRFPSRSSRGRARGSSAMVRHGGRDACDAGRSLSGSASPHGVSCLQQSRRLGSAPARAIVSPWIPTPRRRDTARPS